MKTIQPSTNAMQWPNKAVKEIECRKRDLVFRIADWTRTKEEPALDVETYVKGVYSWHRSETFPVRGKSREVVKAEIAAFISAQLDEIL